MILVSCLMYNLIGSSGHTHSSLRDANPKSVADGSNRSVIADDQRGGMIFGAYKVYH